MAGDPRRVFRAVALERLSSPERLDTLMEVTTVRGWLALAAVTAVVLGALSWGVFGRIPEVIAGSGLMTREGGLFRVHATAAGQVDQILARPGTFVRKGQVVAVLTHGPVSAADSAAGKVISDHAGVVVDQLVDVGQTISPGAPIITLESSTVPIEVSLFIPVEGKRIRPGMRVEMVPGGVKPEESGYFVGTVRSVSLAPISGASLNRYLRNDALASQFDQHGGAYLVDVAVDRDPTTQSGFAWTSGDGPPMQFGSGTLLSGKIVIERRAPIVLVLPALRRWIGV